jgi:hypothetical protein
VTRLPLRLALPQVATESFVPTIGRHGAKPVYTPRSGRRPRRAPTRQRLILPGAHRDACLNRWKELEEILASEPTAGPSTAPLAIRLREATLRMTLSRLFGGFSVFAFSCVCLFGVGAEEGEEDDVADGFGVGEEHGEAIDAYAFACGGG